MKFYYCKSSCSLVVRIILNELNLEFQDVEVDLRTKKTISGEDFLAMNPKGAVPAIRLDNGEILTENQVILQYLTDSTPGQKLLAPVGDFKRYRTLEWLNYISTELHKSIGMFFNPTLPEEVKTKVLTPIIMARFAYINERLTKDSYFMGDQFTLPDAYLFVMLRWAHYFKLDLSSYKNLGQFMAQVQTRPAVIKSLEQEQL